MRAMAHLPTAVMAPNNLLYASSLAPVHIDLTTDVRQPPILLLRGLLLLDLPLSHPKDRRREVAMVLTTSTILRGITLVVVPLLGLGCDQVAKTQHCHYKIEAFHLDKNRGQYQLTIQQHLLTITHHHSQSIILFASPQSLKEGSS
jgi:hypothetical protein